MRCAAGEGKPHLRRAPATASADGCPPSPDHPRCAVCRRAGGYCAAADPGQQGGARPHQERGCVGMTGGRLSTHRAAARAGCCCSVLGGLAAPGACSWLGRSAALADVRASAGLAALPPRCFTDAASAPAAGPPTCPARSAAPAHLAAVKLENDTETFEHERVSSELKKQIQSARLAKKLTQVRGAGAGWAGEGLAEGCRRGRHEVGVGGLWAAGDARPVACFLVALPCCCTAATPGLPTVRATAAAAVDQRLFRGACPLAFRPVHAGPAGADDQREAADHQRVRERQGHPQPAGGCSAAERWGIDWGACAQRPGRRGGMWAATQPLLPAVSCGDVAGGGRTLAVPYV